MIVQGNDMMWFVNGKSIANATSHKLTISAETADTSNKDTGGDWDSQEIKKLSFEGSSENLFSVDGKGSGFDELFDLMIAKTPIDAIFSIEKSASEKALTDAPEDGWTAPTAGGYKGKVIITSLDINAPNGDKATFTVSFKGYGALSKLA